jgi:hypothetical protein
MHLKKAQAEMEKMEAKEKPISKNMFRAIWQKASGAQLRLGVFFIQKIYMVLQDENKMHYNMQRNRNACSHCSRFQWH